MQVILLDKVHNLGGLGDLVKVKPGYGRNFLIPQGKAAPATTQNVAKFEARRAELEKSAQEAFKVGQARAEQLTEKVVTITAKAGDEGRLFGSVGTRDIADAITAQGVKVLKSEILLPNGVIRQVGDYAIGVQLHSDVRVDVQVKIVAEAAAK